MMAFLLITTMASGQRKIFHNKDENTYAHMSEILNEFQALGRIGIEYNNSGQCNITYDNYGYLLLAEYLGEMRTIGEEKKQNLVKAFKAIGFGKEASGMYNQEVYVQTDTGRFWIPIQNQLLNVWTQEVKANDSVLIYVRIQAAYDADSENKWLLVINSFNPTISDGLWREAMSHLQKKNYPIVQRCTQELVRINPDDCRGHALLAYCYANMGNDVSKKKLKELYFHQSDSLFMVSEQLDPGYCHQYFYRAIMHFYRSDYVNSWKMIEKARELKDNEIDEAFVDFLESKLSYADYKKQ